jgi:hypothetical protein
MIRRERAMELGSCMLYHLAIDALNKKALAVNYGEPPTYVIKMQHRTR